MKSILIFVSILIFGTYALKNEDLDLNFNLKGSNVRIVGGKRAELGQFPWAASVREFLDTGLFHVCGAIVIGEEYVLTAAHCCSDPLFLQYHIAAGGIDNYRNETTEQHVKAIKKFKHPDYNSDTFENDICILKVEGWVFNENLQPVALPKPDLRLAENETVTVAGWGSLREGGGLPEYLHYVDLKVVSDELCNACYVNSTAVTDSMICAGDVDDGGIDACSGDSGGPYTYIDPVTGEPVLVGIVSWGYGCARPGYPGVNTEVAYFVDWITEVTGITPP